MAPMLPTYDSKASLSPQSAVTRQGAGRVASAVGNLAEVGMDIAVKWKRAHVEMTAARSDAAFSVNTAKIMQDAQDDVNLDGAQDKHERLKQAFTDAQSMIKDPIVREKANVILGEKKALKHIEIDAAYRKKNIEDYNKNTVPALINDTVQGKMAAGNDHSSAKWQSANAYFNGMLQSAKENNVLSDAEIEQYKAAEREQVIITEASMDPEGTIANLTKPDFYPEMTQEERLDTASKIRTLLNAEKARVKEIVEERYAMASSRLVDGDLTYGEIETLVEANKLNKEEGITQAQGIQLHKGLARRNEGIVQDLLKSGDKAKVSGWMKVINLMASDTAGREEMISAMLEAHDSQWNPEAQKFLIQLTNSKKLAKLRNQGKVWKSLWGAVGLNTVEKQADFLDASMEAFGESNGNTYTFAREALAKYALRRHPNVAALKDVDAIYTIEGGLERLPENKPQEEKPKSKAKK